MTEHRALTFDCYGTLIDWESGILAVLRRWADRAGAGGGGRADDAALLAAFSRAEPAAEAAAPTALYPDILRDTMTRIGADLRAPVTAADQDALAMSVPNWTPFPDTVAALRRLKSRFRLVITSNVDRASFAGTARRLEVPFDAVITAQDAGAYKPALNHFHLAERTLRDNGWIADRAQWLHVAQSLYHDHVPAKSLGLRTAWVDRPTGRSKGATPASSPVAPDIVVRSLAELADALGA